MFDIAWNIESYSLGKVRKLEMCHYDTDVPIQEPFSLWNKDFAKNEVKQEAHGLLTWVT